MRSWSANVPGVIMNYLRQSALLVAAFFTSCMSYNVDQVGTIVAAEKTITIVQGGAGLVGSVKARLRRDGWKVVSDMGPEVTTGKLGEQTHLERGMTFRSRYRLDCVVDAGEPAINGDIIYVYNISMVDNKQGDEVLTMHGRGFGGAIADRLVDAMREITR